MCLPKALMDVTIIKGDTLNCWSLLKLRGTSSDSALRVTPRGGMSSFLAKWSGCWWQTLAVGEHKGRTTLIGRRITHITEIHTAWWKKKIKKKMNQMFHDSWIMYEDKKTKTKTLSYFGCSFAYLFWWCWDLLSNVFLLTLLRCHFWLKHKIHI